MIMRLISELCSLMLGILSFLTVASEDYPEYGRELHSAHIQRMESSGIQVTKLNKYRERFAVIDRSLVWYGSMTLLSNEKEDDSLMRINNPAIAEELLEFAISGRN